MLTRWIQKLTVLLVMSFTCNGKVLIWDLGDVLFKQSRFGIARSIGLSHFASYALGDWKNPNIRPLLFDVLGTLGAQQGPESQRVCDQQGNHLPQIMCDWLTGKVAPHDLIEKAHSCIEDLDAQSYFMSKREKRLIKETVSVIFDPDYCAYYNKPIDKAIRLLNECACYCDDQGKPHTLIVLSNWDSYSFDILYEDYPHIFGLFDHIVISGDIGVAKPHVSAFQHLIKTYKLKPEDCYFIDDQLTNVRAAERCKMNGLWFKDGNYRDLKRRMKEHGLL